jgi:hypothetical protein
MTEKQIRQLQKQFGYHHWQDLIDNGRVWSLEGTAGRTASDLLEAGICFLPEIRHYDYWGNIVPARSDLKAGTKGTLENAKNFWASVKNGETTLEKDEYFEWMQD